MHYPLAMPLLAPTDQRARKELEEPVATAAKQNEARGRGRRGLQMETEGRGRGGQEGGEGYGGHGSVSVASWTHLRGGSAGRRTSWGISVWNRLY